MDMRDPPADALRSDLFESRADERVLFEKYQQEITEQRDVIQQLKQNALEQKAEIDHLKSLLIRYVHPAHFQPETFTSRTPYNTESWWQTFTGCSGLTGVEQSVCRSLLTLLLEHWSVLPLNPSRHMRKPSPRCFFCDKKGHIKRDCFWFLAIQNNDNGSPSSNTNYSRNAYSLGPRFNRGRSLSCDRGRFRGRSSSFDTAPISTSRERDDDGVNGTIHRDNSPDRLENNCSRGHDYDKSSAATEDNLFEPDN
jgi:hypothetical protein